MSPPAQRFDHGPAHGRLSRHQRGADPWNRPVARDFDERDKSGSPKVAIVNEVFAQRIFGDIAAGNSKLLATAQTSHDTDQVIREFVSRDSASVDALLSWMRDGATPVLRVNSAGILAKLGAADLADNVVTALKRDSDTRQLYLTAVVSRVLAFEWEAAARLATTDPLTLAESDPWIRARLAQGQANAQAEQEEENRG